MCGIAGAIQISGRLSRKGFTILVDEMTDSLVHRGPDDRGVWIDGKDRVGLGFRRLAILDLSPEGHQPMRSACGRYVTAFNGEIYNYRELREEVEATGRFPHGFRGHSDTEVLLAAVTVWGIGATLPRLNGMFAIALWDEQDRKLHLVRDRLGKKPVYYGRLRGDFVFASELKALRRHPAFDSEVDRDALALFFRHGFVPAPYTIHPGIRKLPPGTWLTLDDKTGEALPSPRPYWDARATVEHALSTPFEGGEAQAVEALDRLLRDSVKRRMEADVPLGAFLSGGIDSSLVVALMQAQCTRRVRTFTIGFHEQAYDEARHAAEIARVLGTDHTESYVTAREAMDVIPELPTLYDEPFADSSQIPTLLVSRLARRHVTVALSGDGGDELFSGYNRYAWGERLWSRFGWVPHRGRALAANGLERIPPRAWDRGLRLMDPFLPQRLRVSAPADKAHKLADALASATPEDLYLRLISQWRDPTKLVLGASEPPTYVTTPEAWARVNGLAQHMMFLDLVTYLPDDILAKVDRASMGVSLEVRAPLLDYRLVEFAWRLPAALKLREGKGKWILRKLLDRYVPRELVERPKMGFGVPIGDWLRGPLGDWAQSLLSPDRLRREGLLSAPLVERAWREHRSGKRNNQHSLWAVLMFQAWRETLS